MRVRWTDADEPKAWGVYIDRNPVAPGETVSASDDVVVTSKPAITIFAVIPHRGGPKGQRNRHRVVVVRIDDDGDRAGEAYADLTFYVAGFAGA